MSNSHKTARAYGAVVFAADGVRWHAATRTWDELERLLSEYVEAQAPAQLWPGEAAQVEEWFAAGERRRAIDYYFERVGVRWDFEALHVVAPGWSTAPPVTAPRRDPPAGRAG